MFRKFAHLIHRPAEARADRGSIRRGGASFQRGAVLSRFVVGHARGAISASPAIPAHLIWRSRFIRRYGLGLLVRPARIALARSPRRLKFAEASTLAGLADQRSECLPMRWKRPPPPSTAMPRPALISDFSAGAATPINRYLGDPAIAQSLPRHDREAAISMGEVYPGDIGTSLGLRTDDIAACSTARIARSRALCLWQRHDSVMPARYPSGGITLGPANDLRLHRRARR